MSIHKIVEPVMFNKDLGQPLDLNSINFTQKNADGKPVIPMTTEQKYVFDAKGWVMIPNVLTELEVSEMRDFCYQLKQDPNSIPAPERSTYGGPLQALMDHPVIVGMANEFLASPYLCSQECYGFRMEMSFLALRSIEDKEPTKFSPHNGNAMWRMPGDCHEYRCIPGKAYSGLTRVVWELESVEAGDGGTLFITGSHKSAFTAPESAYKHGSSLWETYSCPAGSVIIFTEATTHSGQPWTNPERDRVAIFNAYNSIDRRWTKSQPHPDYLASMPTKRQSLFRDAYVKGNVTGKPFTM